MRDPSSLPICLDGGRREERVKGKREGKVTRIFLILAHSGYLPLTFLLSPPSVRIKGSQGWVAPSVVKSSNQEWET